MIGCSDAANLELRSERTGLMKDHGGSIPKFMPHTVYIHIYIYIQ